MPDSISDSGDVSGANLSSGGGMVLSGFVQTFASGAEDSGGMLSGQVQYDGWAGSPLLQGGVDETVLSGGVDFEDFLSSPLKGGVRGGGPLLGGISVDSPLSGGTQTNANQVVKLDIRNTVVQPIEPCRSIPYLKLVFIPVSNFVRFRRDLRREVSIPVPRPQSITLSQFIGYFTGKVFIKATKYVLRWKQILPVVVEPQDSGSVNYKSADIYDFRTSILLNDDAVIDKLNFSQLPLVQVTKAEDIQGGTLNPEVDDYELYLDHIIFADVDQSTGKLIAKDPAEAGLFLP